ncbi:MAG: hypothetical protein K0S96_513, partial [Geminicoccaceae bacterium]|nr:hypothetical protein [Geminicoccaceae bacterium]
TREDNARIWTLVCAERGLELPDAMLAYLESSLYAQGGVARAGCHPRHLVVQVAAICDYEGEPLRLDRRRLRLAWSNLFVA